MNATILTGVCHAKQLILQSMVVMTLGCLLAGQTAEVAVPPPVVRLLPNQLPTFTQLANKALNHTITGEDMITLAARLEMQADAWDGDGSSAKILAYAKANVSALTSAPSPETIARMYDAMAAQGWQGPAELLQDQLARQTQATRVAAYNRLTSQGVHGVFYGAAAQLRKVAKSYSTASLRGSRLVRVSATAEGCYEYNVIEAALGVTGALYAIAATVACAPCVGIAAGVALVYASLDFLGLTYCG